MLTELQEQVAAAVAALDEAKDFALAGGAALIIQGAISRRTRDLDFFGLAPEAVDQLLPRVEAALQEAGLKVRRVLVNPGFARLEVDNGRERTELDLAADARLFPPEPTAPAPTLSGPELGADKVLAIFGRAEARDFSDLLPLAQAYGLDRLMQLAAEKDLGFRPEYFADMLDRFDRFNRDEFDIPDAEFRRLTESIGSWRQRALELSRGRGIEHDDDVGLGF